jgi:hypothetical protein
MKAPTPPSPAGGVDRVTVLSLAGARCIRTTVIEILSKFYHVVAAHPGGPVLLNMFIGSKSKRSKTAPGRTFRGRRRLTIPIPGQGILL